VPKSSPRPVPNATVRATSNGSQRMFAVGMKPKAGMAAKVVAISDVEGGRYAPQGIDLDEATRLATARESLSFLRDTEPVSNEALLELDCDILIPAAVGNVLHLRNATKVKASIIIEAANHPMTAEADTTLTERGKLIVPDIIANAGGVTVSYFEWVQNRQHFKWELGDVREKLARQMTRAFDDVWNLAQEKKVSLRIAAYLLGVGRVARATKLAGIE